MPHWRGRYSLAAGNPVNRMSDGLITSPVVSMILVSVGCTSLAQISLKHGMSVESVQAALTGGRLMPILVAVSTSPMVWIGLFLYGFSAVVWLFVLAKLPVSVAYSFVALGFLLTMSLGCVVLGEPLTLRKLAGTALVMLGITLVTAGR
jgi:multidrug transporter EmrE-like cation transporter